MTTAILKAKVESIDFPSIDWKKICIYCFFAMLFALCFYVWQVIVMTGGYYAIDSYKAEIKTLTEENKNLQVAFAESSFWGHLSLEMEKMNFGKSNSVKYVQMPGTDLAKR